jgi:Uma2 family endonuclease
MTVEVKLPRLPMSADEFARLPEVDGVRFELEEGNLLAMNATYAAWHGNMVVDLVVLFRQHGLVAVPERTIRLGHGTMRSCDVGVFHKSLEDLHQSVHQPAELAIVAEVVSADSRERDYHLKAREYAAAGIPEYWIVDEHPDDAYDGVVRMHRLVLGAEGHRYEVRRTATVKELASGGW